MTWRKIPPALFIGLVATIVFETIRVAYYVHHDADVGYTWQLLEEGVGVAARVLIAAGALELVRRRPSPGAWLVLGAQVGELAIGAAWITLAYLSRSQHDVDLFAWMRRLDYAGSVAMFASALGFGLVSRQHALVIALAVLAVIGVPLPPVAEQIYPNAEHWTIGLQIVVRFSPFAILPLGFLIASAFASADLPDAPPVPADRPFEQLARALWVRVIAACTLAGVTVLVASSSRHDGATMLRFATVAAPFIDVLALAAAARAALGLARARFAPWQAVVAAGGFLWCVGVTAARLPSLYLVTHESEGSFGSMFMDETVQIARAWTTTVPVVASAAVALVLIAITQLARRRGLDDLRENASVRTGVFVVLALGALFITRYGVERVLEGGAIGPVLVAVVGAAGASIYALVIAAKLCAQAAHVIASDPAGLPAATVIKDGAR